ncbi:CvpA family protein [Caldicellulosiruptor morganii]|uniref:CvpA family protein n=1 Tax=Caldicellulosiruptor morganii TaxID=1387555 RepID=A0ABY7BQX8_9FIRM|nr:CvpA family protein [Caldicellulosiruptor morganii]WAM33849.1 CvpA family protein [Caldicellulosiruptor morganii]
MLNSADLIVLIVLIAGAWVGYRKGLLRMAFDLGSYIISWFVAVWGYRYVSRAIESSSALKGAIESFVKDKVVLKDTISPAVPELFRSATVQAHQALNKSLQDAATAVLINFIAMIATFIAAKIAILAIKNALGFMRKVPVIGTVDGFAGLLAGIAASLIIIYIAFSIIYFFPNAELFKTAQKFIRTSMFAEFLYENNILIMMMKQYLGLKI